MAYGKLSSINYILISFTGIIFSAIIFSGCTITTVKGKTKAPLAHIYRDPEKVIFVPFYKNTAEGFLRPYLLNTDLKGKRGFFYQALYYFKQKEWDEAYRLFRSAYREYPYLKDYATFFMAVCMENKGIFEDAASLLSEIINVWPQSILVPEATLKLADMYFCQQDYYRATEVYKRSLKILPEKEAYIRYQIGLCGLENNLESAAESFKALITEKPDSEFSRLALEHVKAIYREDSRILPMDNLEGANREDGLLSLFKSPDLQNFPKAEELFKRRKYGLAIKVYQSVINDESDIVNRYHAMYRLAQCYEKTWKRDLAIEVLEKLIETDPALGEPEWEFVSRARLLLARILWNKNRNKEALSHLEYLSENRPYWDKTGEVLYLMGRMAEERGLFSDAMEYYKKIVSQLTEDDFYQIAVWRIGWVYYIAGYYDLAESHFENYLPGPEGEDGYESRHKFLYWKARVKERQAKWNEAEDIYKKIMNEEYWSFYSGLAQIRLGRRDDSNRYPYFIALKEELISQDAFLLLSEKEKAIIKRIWELWLLGLKDEAIGEIRHSGYSKMGTSTDLLYTLAILAHVFEAHNLGIRLGILYKNRIAGLYGNTSALSSAAPKTGDILIYPPGFLPQVLAVSKQFQLDPILVLSQIRQESLFDPAVLSSASAYGLMQVIPSTGKSSAKALDIDLPPDMTCLFDIDLNLILGCYYLKKVLDSFEQNLIYALAAYNAGPGAVLKWQKRFRDLEMDEFIESIPYGETREYVKRVMKNYAIYSRLSDINRGLS